MADLQSDLRQLLERFRNESQGAFYSQRQRSLLGRIAEKLEDANKLVEHLSTLETQTASPPRTTTRRSEAGGSSKQGRSLRSGAKWPVEAKAYIDMLQHPERAFREERFQKGKVRVDDTGLPDAIVGGAAVIFRMTDANGEQLAVRVFKSTGSDQGNESDREKSYELISNHIAQTNPSCLVEFKYIPSSIRASKEGVVRSYPMVTMQWVNGQILSEWLRQQCRRGYTNAISDLADQWVDLIRELREAKIAHGDLEDANVMVTDQGELKLVDYDCMYVPEMGKKVNPEIGKPPYQHPE